MMRYSIAMMLALAACRSGPTKVSYRGPQIAQCAVGRPYAAPPPNTPTTAFVPLTPVATTSRPDVEPPPATDAPEQPPADDAAVEKPTKPTKSTKKKKKKKKEQENP